MNTFRSYEGLKRRSVAVLTALLAFSASQVIAQSVTKTGRDLTTQSTTDTQVGRTVRYAVSLGFPAGQTAAAVDVSDAIPSGMEYVAGSLKLPSNAVGAWSINNGTSYVGVEPSPTSAVTNLRVTGSSRMAATSAMGTLRTPPVARASGGAGGDGYRAIPYNGKVYSIYHHNEGDALYCGDQATGTACPGFPTSVPAASGSPFVQVGMHTGNWYRTFNVVHDYLDRNTGRLYFYAVNNTTSKPVVVCADLAAQTSCGSYEFSNAASLAKSGNFSSGGQQGSRYYTSTNDGRMLCFDTATFAPCAGTGADGAFPVSGTRTALATHQTVGQVGSRLYWPQTDNSTWPYPPGVLACFDMAINGDCAGFSGSATNNYVGRLGFLPTANSAGVADGMCFEGYDSSFTVLQAQCFDLNGNDITSSKSAFRASLKAHPTPMGRYSYGLLLNGRTYWQDWRAQLCWDWSSDAACAGYDPATGSSPEWYETTYDPANPTCVWALGDDGRLTATDAINGGPCTVEVKAQVQASPAGNYCDGKPHSVTWSRIDLVGLQASDYASAKVTIRDASNNILPGWNAATATFPIDLSAYPTSGATASLSVEVELLGITNATPFNADPKPYISVQWNGDAQQICYDAKLSCGAAPVSALTNTVSGLIAGTAVTGSHTFSNIAQSCWDPSAPQEITVTKTSSTPGPIAAGGAVDYVVTVTNVGTMVAPQLHLTDLFPSGLQSASWTCAASGGTPAQTCVMPSGTATAPNPILDQTFDLQPGATVTYQISAVAGNAVVTSTANTVTAEVAGGAACSKGGLQQASCSATSPAGQPGNGGAVPVPSLGQWALMLLSIVLAGFAVVRLRRQQVR